MLHLGRRIGDFIIERELGRGGMGIVYSAVNEQTAERVAIKMLSPHLLPDPRQRRRFQLEAYAAGQIQHDGLVRVLRHGELDQAEPYIMMEYLDGASLRQVLQAAPAHRFSIEAAVQIALQLAEVLDSAHKSGFLHRDIKPSNVMLLGPLHEPERCRVKLLDFGLARLLTEGEGSTLSEGDVIGTPAYMSPEQCEGRAELDGHSDVYGLGALLFELLCGRTPFIGPPPRMMYQHVYESVPAPDKYRSELSPELSAFVAKMLAKAPSDRPTIGKVAAELRAWCRRAPLPPPAPIRVDATRMSDKARLWIGMLVLINIALAVSLWRAVPIRPDAREVRPPAPVVPSPPHSIPTPPLATPTPEPVTSAPAAPAPLPPRSGPPPKRPAPMPARTAKSPAVRVPPKRESGEVKAPPPDPSPAPPVAAPQPAPAPTRQKVEYWK